MTKLRLRINLLLVMIAASYLTLGLANSSTARSLWWVYALASAVLATTNLWLDRREHLRGRR